jgi:hypothetical protein
MIAVQGHFKDRIFISEENIAIPDGSRVIVTFLDLPQQRASVFITESERQRKIFKEISAALREDAEELPEEFDKIINEGLKFNEVTYNDICS